ncbi:MAG: hypothetical protein RL745_777 [Actinomycetota bacterium]
MLVPPNVAPALDLAQRLHPPVRNRWLHGWRAWIGPGIATVIGALLRWPKLGWPRAFVFDETYYAKDAYAMLKHGIEWNWDDKADSAIVAAKGDPVAIVKLMDDSASYVVHPPIGKWVISLGEMMFGLTPFGWRFMVCLLGTLAVLIVAWIAQMLTRSAAIGALAGLLMAIDGTAIVLSRTAILDGILTFFILCAVLCIIVDYRRIRRSLAQQLSADFGSSTLLLWQIRPPRLGLRPWLWVAGMFLGLAVSTKWSALWHIAFLGLLVLGYSFATRRLVGDSRALTSAVLRDGLLLAAAFLLLPMLIYTASWTGWFISADSYNKHWAADVAATGVAALLPMVARSWLHFHHDVWNFHVTLTSHHDYQANAWSWPVLGRPTSFWYSEEGTCAADKCSSEVTSMGNPIIWWAGLIAVLHQAWVWFSTRSRASLTVVVLWFAGWFPWLLYQHRTIFFFYAVVMVPFTCIALAMSLTHIARGVERPNRNLRIAVVTAVVVAAIAMSWFFMPVWVGDTLTYAQWRWRMWFDTWI